MNRFTAPSAAGAIAASERGFTLIELMVTIAVAAIILSLAIPSFTEATLGSKLRATANNLAAAATLARSEAIKRREQVVLCASSNGSSCGGSWEQGWIVLGGSTVIRTQGAAPKGFKVNGDQSSLTFQPTGVGSTPANFTVCRATPSVGSQERTVTISATGRASVERTSAGACS
ncbi:GspH/FimT family pseudopilin [Pseudomonas sp.]|uniref:GspH/FimT family pseudopilin n=1 Tax=Pseudomonas sp. TaxID=306 RepID=UPI00272B47BA|nr:GspH/FimT family pseudopilin [Pseudomonas sp.]